MAWSGTGGALDRRVRGGILGLADRDALEVVRDRADEGPRRGLEDVGRDSLAPRELAVGPDRDADLAGRVGAAGDRLDLEALELGVRAGRLTDRSEDRVHGAVAGSLR